MYLELDENLKKEITNITNTSYDFKGNYLNANNIISVIEDLIGAVHIIEEEQEKREKFVEDNYRQITPSEMYGIDNSDFMEELWN